MTARFPAARTPALAALLLLSAACARGGTSNAPAPVAVPAVSSTPAPAADAQTTIAAAVRSDSLRGTPSDSVSVSPSDVTREAVAVFGDSVATDSGEVDTPEAVTFDIDVRSYETRASVERYVGIFTGSAKGRFTQWLERGTRYEPMIRAKFRAGGLPEDMGYLALIESGYHTHAYSRAAAVGMWQFMSSTGKGTGLRIDWWVDERRDPVAATDAAVKFITWLRSQFGSLYLAAAAYNGGPGRVSRGLTRYADEMEGASGEDRFFALAEHDYLRAETKNYVPQLIAAALVAKEPARYGLQVRPQPVYAYDSVRVPASTPLAAVARASGSTVADVRELNPHILRGMMPPTGALWTRVPVGTAPAFAAAFEALPESERTSFSRVTSRKGETLARVALRTGRSAKQLGWYNRSLRTGKRGVLVAGQTLLVPSAAVVAAAMDVPDPSIERYGSSKKGSSVATHVVKRGETLGGIARRYKTTAARIRTLNRMKKDMIFAGQTLIVKGSVPAARRGSSRSAAKPRSASKGKASTSAKGSSRSGKAAVSKRSAVKRAPAKATGSRGASSKAPARAGAKKPAVTRRAESPSR